LKEGASATGISHQDKAIVRAVRWGTAPQRLAALRDLRFAASA